MSFLARGSLFAVLVSLVLPAASVSAPSAEPARAPAATAAGLDLPLYDPAAGAVAVPAYAARRFEVRFAPGARPARVARLGPLARTGHLGVDRLLDRFAVPRIEPEFPGAVPPPPGSREPDLSGYYVVHLPAGAPLPEAIAAFRTEAGIESADPIGVFPVQAVPNDSLFFEQYAFSQVSDRDADLPEAWDVTQGDTSVVVGIVDTGVLWTHPDIGGPPPYTSGNLWHNWVEMAGVAGLDDDANGYVDDVIGWDFVTSVSGRAGEDLSVPDNDPSDFVGHGTRVAGIAGAIANNVSGVAGAGYRVKVLPLRAGWDDGQGAGGVVDMSFCAQAIYYAARAGAAAINCSWNNGNLSGLGAAVDFALARGSTVVVAGGNQGSAIPAANYLVARGDCVDVAALDDADGRASFSNYGLWVDVSGGGVGIRSTFSNHYAPTYSSDNGTSFSAPLVTGIVGLYQSWRRSQGLTPARPSDVLWRLHDTADPVDAVNPGFEGMLGGGRVNALRMLQDPPTSFVADAEGPVSGAPALVDWGGASLAVVFGNEAGILWALDGKEGALLPGWPFYAEGGFRASPAAWDVDFDGRAEIVAGSDDGVVHAVRADGSEAAGWPATLGGTIAAETALGDVAGDPAYEIVVIAGAPAWLHVLDRHGDELPGWPVALPAAARGAPAVADLDGEAPAEIVVGADDSTVYAFRGDGTPLAGWPIRVGGAVASSPAVGDLDEDGVRDVVVGADDGKVHAWSAVGAPLAGWPVTASGAVRAGPALADVDGDLHLDVVAGTELGRLYVWKRDGATMAGWGVVLGGAVRGSPTVADVDHDGSLDVVAGTQSSTVHARRADGAAVPGWPRSVAGAVVGGGTFGDPDRDGRLELAIGSADSKLYCWDLGPGSYDAGRLPWPTARRSILRQGTVTDPAIGVAGRPARPRIQLSLAPNPGRGPALVRLAAGGQAGAGAMLSLYDAAGRLVRREQRILDGLGFTTWTLREIGETGRLAPGLYFVEARAGEARACAKWVLLP